MTRPHSSKFQQSLQLLLSKGPRFLLVSIFGNLLGYILGVGVYSITQAFTGVFIASVLGGLIHNTITYSSHYLFTFPSVISFLQGWIKSLGCSALAILLLSAAGTLVIHQTPLPFWLVQLFFLGMGVFYSIVTNFFFIFRRPSRSLHEPPVEPL